MSNLTPQDVDVKLTATRNELAEEDARLWEGLEDEKVSRIAGDEANKQFTMQVQGENASTESRLSTEVIHRSEGDLTNITSLNALAVALSEYRIKTDLEITNEKIARQQLGVDLNTRVDNFVASWDHDKFLIYTAIQAVQTDVDGKYASMDLRIKKYEEMLQDITMDSIQITMDNGEINMGAWTILSQAREWDLEILAKFKDFKAQTESDLNQALEDIQNQLPNVENIINSALEAFAGSEIVQNLEAEIGGLEVTIDGVTQTMMQHRIDVQNEMIDLSSKLGDTVKAETEARKEALTAEQNARIEQVQKETATRTEQFKLMDDGLTVEINERIEGDNKAYELIENLKSSSEGSLADVYSKIEVNTTNITANAGKIEQVTAEVAVAKDDAGKALVNSATALEQANSAVTATNALAERVTSTEASLDNKVDIVVFNQTKAEVERIDGVTKANAQEITTIKGNIQNIDGTIAGHTQAIDALTVTQTQFGDTLNQVVQDTTVLTNKVTGLDNEVKVNTQAITDTKAEVTKNGTDIKALTEKTTTVEANVDNIKSGGDNLLKKSNVPAVWNPADPKYPHGKWDMSEPWEVGATYTLTVCVTHKSTVGETHVAFYAGGGRQYVAGITNAGDRFIRTIQFVKTAVDANNPNIQAYLSGWETNINAIGTIHWVVMTKGASVGVTNWKPSNQDTVDGLANTASASALQNLKAEVSVIDGKVVANTNDLTVLKSTVDSNQAYIINNYYTKTDAYTATAKHITQFKSTLYVGARNLLINSDFRKGLQGWGTYEATVTINNAATIDNKPSSYAFIRGGVGGIYKSHGNIPHKFTTTEDVTFSLMVRGNGRLRLGFNATFKDFTISDTVNWTRITHTQKGVPNSDMVCYLISGTYIDVAYLKVELGSIPTEWSPAPEDDIRDIETTATAVNSISTQVAEIDGKVTAQASQVLTLESFTDNIINGVIPGNKVATVNLTAAGYDSNTWYPVAVSTIKTTERTNLAVYTVLNQSGVPPWATHASGFSCNLQWSTLGSGWGVNQVENNIEAFTYAYSAQSPIMGPRQLTTASKPYVWLRGGGTYKYSLPQNNTLEICQPNGTIAGIGSESVGPTAYNANTVPLSVVKQGTDNSVQLQQTNEVVDGVKAVSTVSVDNNGFISGYGLISQLVNGVVQSAFGVNADYFYVGTANSNKKKPFMVLTSPQTIGGVTYPAGTWMDVALIANATIGTAHIQDASITNAKIKDLNADKITAGTLDANRIGANSITAEKLVIGDTTNLWGNQYFETNVRPNQARTAWFGYTKELKGRGVQMWGRDHMAPYSTRIPLKTGDEFVIEFTAGFNTGAFKALGVGLWVYDATGSQGTNAFQFGVPEQIATLGNGWYRYRRVFTVADNGSGLPAAYGTLYFQIPQSDTETSPTYWTAGDVIVRKRMGGELIVNGAITADKLFSNTVSGMFANFGTFTTTGAGGSTTLSGASTIVRDTGGTERIFIGIR